MTVGKEGAGPVGFVVVGGAAGIGGAILREMARAEPAARFWITYYSDHKAAQDLAASLPNAEALRCDVSSPNSLADLARSVRGAGVTRLRGLVHAAVEARPGSLYSLGSDTIGAVIQSSAMSLLDVVKAFDHMLGSGSSVIFLTSIGSRRAIPDYGAVGIAKAAGEALVRYLAVELAPRGIRVNSLSPGAVRTKAFDAMFENPEQVVAQMAQRSPRGKALELDEVAFVATSLCDPRCTGVSGQVITIDGGYYAMR